MPAVSVVLPVYNAEKYLQQAVTSIVRQTFTDFELILMNDGSTDSSGEIIADFAAKDSRIRTVSRQNKGLIATLNEGLAIARAPLVARMDADDVAMPQRFALQVAEMNKRPDLVLLGSAIVLIDSEGRCGRKINYPRGKDLIEHFLWGSPFAHPAVMMRKKAVLDSGGYCPLFKQGQDYDLWLRLLAWGTMDNLPESLLYYRWHGDNSVIKNARSTRTSTLMAQARWLSMCQTGVDPFKNLGAFPDFSHIPLEKEERIFLLARILAHSAHLMGDTHEDAEGAEWLAGIKASEVSSSPAIRKAMGIYHLRCARRYLPVQAVRGLEHLAKSLFYSPTGVFKAIGKCFS